VQAFLNRKIGFLSIAATIRRTMDAHGSAEILTLEDALQADTWARGYATKIIEVLSAPSVVVH
jgi:1-deoxy-D-xylulose 5-phosphate reductoisomerase